MKTADIRESFLSFFEGKGCKRLPSSSLIPDDPSLLLTSAGMVQFKPVFLGATTPSYTRATTCQKCVRTTDIDIIGTTGRHLSFFEMLGNFSFGDYFKREAIRWAWEYSTDVLGLDPQHIWATVYLDDDESWDLWLEESGVPAERIRRLGEEDNFWAAGPTGPCGPCSELYYDQGESFGCGSPDCAPGCDCDRYLEYWNLVFMQYNRDEDGVLTPLPKQNIDTGMGLERIAAILQKAGSNYETDLLRRVMALVEDLTGRTYGQDEKTDIALRIITDHARSVTFMVADGILPSNEGRGYVLRRLLRRAIRYGRLLGTTEPFLVAVAEKVIDEMGAAYPELVQHRDLISGIIGAEEERFGATLRTGIAFLETELHDLSVGDTLSGTAAFTLHDTYGFPIDLTVEIASEHGVSVDLDEFAVEMDQQKSRARSHVKDESWSTFGGVFSELFAQHGATEFLGYCTDEAAAAVQAIVVDGKSVTAAAAGAAVEVLLDKTPFYGERGGQVGDHGTLTADGVRIEVTDTKIRAGELVSHVGVIAEGTVSVGDVVTASIDVLRRERIRRNHTATHLLHWALNKILGSHTTQAGSFVGPDRLRFDFTHFEAVTPEQLDRVERMVNAKVFENHPVRAYDTSLDTARESGVTALFGEKYGEFVRVLEVGNFSKELCGGTHIGRTSEIGFVKITSESSVGANLRRIEAVTSFDAYEYTLDHQRELSEAAAALGVPRRDVAERAASLSKRVRELEQQAKRAVAAASSGGVEALVAQAVEVPAGYRALVADLGAIDAGTIKSAWDVIRERGVSAAVLTATDEESSRLVFLAAGTDEAVAAGFSAGAIIKAAAAEVGGRGGGKPTMAQGGADLADRAGDVLDLARRELGL